MPVSFGSSASPYTPTRPAQAAVEASVAGAAQPTSPKGGGVPLPYFGITVFLRNASGEPITVERVHAVFGASSPALRQIGAGFNLFKPELCRPGTFCQINWVLGGGDFSPGSVPAKAEPLSPLTVPPGHTAEGQLNFRILGCTGRFGEAVAVRKLNIVYALPNGSQILQHPRLRAAHPPERVVTSAGAADAWTGGTLPNRQLTGLVGAIKTNACHR